MTVQHSVENIDTQRKKIKIKQRHLPRMLITTTDQYQPQASRSNVIVALGQSLSLSLSLSYQILIAYLL